MKRRDMIASMAAATIPLGSVSGKESQEYMEWNGEILPILKFRHLHEIENIDAIFQNAEWVNSEYSQKFSPISSLRIPGPHQSARVWLPKDRAFFVGSKGFYGPVTVVRSDTVKDCLVLDGQPDSLILDVPKSTFLWY